MKKIFLGILLLTLTLLCGFANAATYNVMFEDSENLAGAVVAFQADSTLSSGESLVIGDLTIGYQYKFEPASASTVDNGGAVPGTDYSEIGGAPNTNWDIDILGNTIVGYTLSSDPLVSGLLFSLTLSDDVELSLTNWVLGDDTGVEGALMQDRDYWVFFDPGTDTFTITGTVPVPSSLLLLGCGLCTLIGSIRRRKIG